MRWALLVGFLGCPTYGPPRTVDARDVTRCEHGPSDDQSFTKQTWRACDDAARSLLDEVPGSSLRYTHKACDLGYADGCLHWLDYVFQVAQREPEIARAELDAARSKGVELCEKGLFNFEGHEYGTARACLLTARLLELEPKDDAARRRLLDLGCEKDAARCPRR